MKITKNILIAIVISFVSSSQVWSEDSTVQPLRLCVDSDLRGTFKLVDLKETPSSQEEAWFHDYSSQFIAFYPNHTYNFIASKKMIKTADELKKAMAYQDDQGFHQIKKYTLDPKGELDLYLGDRVDYYYRCIISAKDTVTTQKGDMTLMGYSKNNTSLNKLFRPWH